jgi:hypothetical protein
MTTYRDLRHYENDIAYYTDILEEEPDLTPEDLADKEITDVWDALSLIFVAGVGLSSSLEEELIMIAKETYIEDLNDNLQNHSRI